MMDWMTLILTAVTLMAVAVVAWKVLRNSRALGSLWVEQGREFARLRQELGDARVVLARHSDRLYNQVQAYQELLRLLDPVLPLPAMRGSAISPDMAVLLASRILTQKPARVVELGSGVSTLVTAYALKRAGGGHVWSLDHEEKFAEITRRNLAAHGLSALATVIHAPIKPVNLDGKAWPWYDTSALASIEPVDLVFVDGPPRMLGADSRFPALPLLRDKLNPNAVMILDDADRPGEKDVLKHWQARFPEYTQEHIPTEKGTVMLHR